MSDVIIKKSKIHGNGVFAGRIFRKGEIVLSWNPVILTNEQAEKLSPKEKDFLVVDGDKYLLMQPPERYVNHSCDANTIPKDHCDIAIRDIIKGEEIISDYLKIEPPSNFRCNCGKC